MRPVWFLPVVRAGQAVLELTPAPRMRHLSLTWSAVRGPVRERVEAEMRRELEAVEAPYNPVAGWLRAT